MKDYWVNDIGAHLYIRDETDIWGFIQDGRYEPEETELIKKMVRKDDICLDIGANIGYYTVLMSKKAKYVYAFEPELSNYKVLLDNIVVNNLHNVLPLMFAVGDKNDVIDLHLCRSNHGMHRVYPSKWCTETVSVQMVRLDEEFPELEVNFVKIDVEGAELDVINGMYKTIEKHKPNMLIEFHPPTIEEKGDDPEKLYYRLKVLGYNIYLAPDVLKPINYEDLYYRTNDTMGGQNIICIPSKN